MKENMTIEDLKMMNTGKTYRFELDFGFYTESFELQRMNDETLNIAFCPTGYGDSYDNGERDYDENVPFSTFIDFLENRISEYSDATLNGKQINMKDLIREFTDELREQISIERIKEEHPQALKLIEALRKYSADNQLGDPMLIEKLIGRINRAWENIDGINAPTEFQAHIEKLAYGVDFPMSIYKNIKRLIIFGKL